MFYQQPMYQQPIMFQQQQPKRQLGSWTTAKSYDEIQNTPIPIDGTQTIFMLESQPVLYVASMDNGRKIIQGYSFTPLVSEANTKQASNIEPQPNNSLEKRLESVEAFVSDLRRQLGVDSNESNITTASTAVPATTRKHVE